MVGGACGGGLPGINNAVEIYDPVMSSWSISASLPSPREIHTATLLPNGTALVVGGDNGDIPRYDSGLIYYPNKDLWEVAASLSVGRRNHTATLLDNGTVLVAGGWGNTTTFLSSAELYSPPDIQVLRPTETIVLLTHTAALSETPDDIPDTPLPTDPIGAPTEIQSVNPQPEEESFFDQLMNNLVVSGFLLAVCVIGVIFLAISIWWIRKIRNEV